mmetsp:Transcript_12114/g.33246  ORF Transcript_12114/g.33246 Transcript_12114/m.33246 type:complete len:333 (+) Transcript_12114:599-1597(+)
MERLGADLDPGLRQQSHPEAPSLPRLRAQCPLDAGPNVRNEDGRRPPNECLEERPVTPRRRRYTPWAVQFDAELHFRVVAHEDGGIACFNPDPRPWLREFPCLQHVEVHSQPPPGHPASVRGTPQGVPQDCCQRREAAQAVGMCREGASRSFAVTDPSKWVKRAPRERSVQEAEQCPGRAPELVLSGNHATASAPRGEPAPPILVEGGVPGERDHRQPQRCALGILHAPRCHAPQLEEGADEEAERRADVAGLRDAAIRGVEEPVLGAIPAPAPATGGAQLPWGRRRPNAAHAQGKWRWLRTDAPDAAHLLPELLLKSLASASGSGLFAEGE